MKGQFDNLVNDNHQSDELNFLRVNIVTLNPSFLNDKFANENSKEVPMYHRSDRTQGERYNVISLSLIEESKNDEKI